LKNKNIKLAIFDFDGTLYNKKGFAFRLVMKNLSMAFVALTERIIRKKFKGKDFGSAENYYDNFFTEITKRNLFFTAKYYEKWYFKRYLPSFCKILEKHYNADERVVGIFDYLHKNNIKIAINSDYPFVGERMQAIGLDYEQNAQLHYFSSEDYGALKPATRPFLEIANKFNCEPSNCIVIGDRADTEGECAKKTGMDFIQISFKKDKNDNAVSWEELEKILKNNE
jgi:FMN phosphatase YigB (HAD superfamily)